MRTGNGFRHLKGIRLCGSAATENLCTGQWEIADAGPLAGCAAEPPGRGEGAYQAFSRTVLYLVPDKSAIESNVQRALYLSDESAIGYYRNLQEKGYFNRMIAGNISQTLTVDSIGGNFDSYPYEMRAYCRQHIIRSSSVTERSLVTTCRLRNVTRSDNNPQGFLIEGFTIIENRDIGQYER